MLIICAGLVYSYLLYTVQGFHIFNSIDLRHTCISSVAEDLVQCHIIMLINHNSDTDLYGYKINCYLLPMHIIFDQICDYPHAL